MLIPKPPDFSGLNILGNADLMPVGLHVSSLAMWGGAVPRPSSEVILRTLATSGIEGVPVFEGPSTAWFEVEANRASTPAGDVLRAFAANGATFAAIYNGSAAATAESALDAADWVFKPDKFNWVKWALLALGVTLCVALVVWAAWKGKSK